MAGERYYYSITAASDYGLFSISSARDLAFGVFTGLAALEFDLLLFCDLVVGEIISADSRELDDGGFFSD